MQMKKRIFKIAKRIILVFVFLTILLFSYLKISGQTINEAGLNFLSWVKNMSGDSVDFSQIEKENASTISHLLWTELLSNNVNASGKVNYKGFIEEVDKFNIYLTLLSNNPPAKNWNEDEKLAYWINAYNAFTVKLIIDHYPVKSIKNIGGSVTMINSA